VTWRLTAERPDVTEVQAGTYLPMDNFHAQRLGDFETALSEATTVISRQPGRVIVDAGTSLWE